MNLAEFLCSQGAYSFVHLNTTLFRRTTEHARTQIDSAISKHFTRCQAYQDIVGIFKINECEIDIKEFQINAVRENSKILHQCDNWLPLCFS